MKAGLLKWMSMWRTTKEKPGASFSRRLEQRAVVGADQAQVIGAAALHEAQVARVIDDAGKIGVLVVDAHLLVVHAVRGFRRRDEPSRR